MKTIRLYLLAVSCMLVLCICGCQSTDTTGEGQSTEKIVEAKESDRADNTSDCSDETSGTESTTEASEDTEGEEIRNMIYVALGDSLTKGYGISDAEKCRFSALTANKLAGTKGSCTERNYGVNGLESGELLGMIKENEIGMLDYADVITIDIGANDVLHASEDMIFSTFAESVVTTEEYNLIETGVARKLANFRNNLDHIVAEVRNVNDHAQIILCTIYNPYKDAPLPLLVEGQELTLAGFTDDLVCRLNANIKEIAGTQGCTVADWYTAFELNPNKLVNATYENGQLTDFDIHPNKDGHAVMAEVCYQAIK